MRRGRRIFFISAAYRKNPHSSRPLTGWAEWTK
jgi:hypothetical protein